MVDEVVRSLLLVCFGQKRGVLQGSGLPIGIREYVLLTDIARNYTERVCTSALEVHLRIKVCVMS